jgi:ABC-type phosphate transport system substrate-binding protein
VRASRIIPLAGAAIAVLGLGVGTALADPASTPPAQSIVAVGSDTLTPTFDQFSTDYDATSPTYPLYSWDATGTSPIETKNNTACTDTTRPNGSGAGISAVSTSPSFTSGGTSYQCMDLARSSRALASTDPTNMAQDVIAEDLISYSYLPSGNIPSNLTPTDLKAIFSCNASLINSADSGPVTEAEIGGKGTDAVLPVIPQSSSGTRSTWLVNDLGLSNTTVASCVVNGSYTYSGTAYPIEENEGTNPVFNPSDDSSAADVIFPYSGGDFVCYNDTAACAASQFGTEFDSGSLVLGDVKSGTTTYAPLTGTAPDQTINVAGFYTDYDRSLYVDFISTGAKPYVPTYLQALLGTDAKGTGWICSKTSPATGQADITKYGFADNANCGTITLTP